VKKEIPAEIVYEDEGVVAILDIHPCAPGHTVVIPRRHAETILSLADDELGPVMRGVKNVTVKLLASLKADGFTVGVNHGRVAGQVVEHLHIHVIPRWAGDGGGSIHSVVRNAPRESLEEIKKRIVGS
ncbi:MAG: HIT family protein, partial [Patescibacteria group bacterium]